MVSNHSNKTFQLKGKSQESVLVPFHDNWSKGEKPSEIKLPLLVRFRKETDTGIEKKYLLLGSSMNTINSK